MATDDRDIDLTTLRQVEHLLATTNFASIEDLARRGEGTELSGALQDGARASTAGSGNSEGLSPLPKRR